MNGPATLIRGARLLTLEGAGGTEPVAADLLVEGDRIAAIGPGLAAPPGAAVIDGRDRLVMPGLVNGHLHSSEQLFKGRYAGMPLEIWLLYAYPLLMDPPIDLELLRLRSLLVAIESLKGGVTTICDCFFDPPDFSLERLGTVFAAYEAAGIRANVASSVINIPTLDSLPWGREVVPPELQAALAGGRPVSGRDYADFCAAAFAAFDGRAGRLRYMVSPSAPQRCTPDLLAAAAELAHRHGVPVHMHALETKTQAVTGALLAGKSPIRHLRDLGLLDRHVTIAHAVWVSEADMALLGEAGCSVVHNAISNQKLGSGVAPLSRLMAAGVTIGLGTDGVAANDSLSLFDVIRVAALLHSTTGPDYGQWLSPDDILHAATIGGARTAMLDGETGSLAVGKKADLLVLRTDTPAFTPLNRVANHLAFGENGSSIELVMVNGEIVVREGRLTRLDEAGVLAEVRERVPPYLARHAAVEARNRVFEPCFAEIHRRATLQDVGMQRWAGDAPPWPGTNRR